MGDLPRVPQRGLGQEWDPSAPSTHTCSCPTMGCLLAWDAPRPERSLEGLFFHAWGGGEGPAQWEAA